MEPASASGCTMCQVHSSFTTGCTRHPKPSDAFTASAHPSPFRALPSHRCLYLWALSAQQEPGQEQPRLRAGSGPGCAAVGPHHSGGLLWDTFGLQKSELRGQDLTCALWRWSWVGSRSLRGDASSFSSSSSSGPPWPEASHSSTSVRGFSFYDCLDHDSTTSSGLTRVKQDQST